MKYADEARKAVKEAEEKANQVEKILKEIIHERKKFEKLIAANDIEIAGKVAKNILKNVNFAKDEENIAKNALGKAGKSLENINALFETVNLSAIKKAISIASDAENRASIAVENVKKIFKKVQEEHDIIQKILTEYRKKQEEEKQKYEQETEKKENVNTQPASSQMLINDEIKKEAAAIPAAAPDTKSSAASDADTSKQKTKLALNVIDLQQERLIVQSKKDT